MAEEVIDALVLAARFDEQGLAASERSIINRLESISARMSRLDASGQIGPFRDLSRDVVAASGAFRRGEISVAQFNEALQFSRNQMIALRQQGYEPNAKQLNLLNDAIDRTAASLARQASAAAAGARSGFVGEQLGKVAKGADSAAAGIARMRSGVAQLAVTSLGTSAAIGQVAQGLIFLSGVGTTGIIVAAVGVAALSKAWELFTKGQREAKEAREGLAASLAKRVAGDVSQSAQVSREIAATVESQALAEREILKVEKERRSVMSGMVFELANEYRLRQLTKKVAEDQRTVDAGLLALAQARTNAFNATQQFQDTATSTKIAALAAAPELGTDTPASIRERRAELARLTAITRDHTVSLIERNAAQSQINDLNAFGVKQEKALADQAKETARIVGEMWRAFFSFAGQEAEASERLSKFFRDAHTHAQEAFGKQVDLGFDRAVDSTKDLDDSLTNAAASSNSFFRNAVIQAARLSKGIDLTRTDAEKLADSIFEVTDGLAGIARQASSLGLIGEEADRSIGSVLNLADALAAVAAKASTGNILGAVGAGIGVLGAVFGKDATQQEHERIQEQNTQALERNTAAIEAASTAGGLARTQGSLRQALSSDIGQLARFFAESPLTFGDRGARAFDVALQAAGSSLADLQAIAEANGIQILDSKGRLVAGALDNLSDALDRANIETTSLANTFADQSRAAELRSRLAGEPQDAAAAFARELAAIGAFSPGVQQAFAGVDLGDEDAVRQAALSLFDQFKEGFFTAHPELFGDISKEDFLDFLGQSADFLDQFGDAVKDATADLGDFNLPLGFKRQLFGFEAMPFGPSRPGDGAALPLPGGGPRANTTTNTVHVTVNLNGAPAPAEVEAAARRGVRAALLEEAHLVTGDTMGFGMR